jgi:tetratricopeptide (TPR) repeat protein
MTWRTTVGRVGYLARSVLRLTAFLAPDIVPVSLLEASADLLGQGAGELTDGLPEGVAVTPLGLRLALGELADYSMVALREDGLSVHRLVQAVQCDELDGPGRRTWAERAVKAVDAAFPYIEFANWAACARLVPHARAAAVLVREGQIRTAQAARMLNQAGFYLYARGQYPEAEPLYRQALEVTRVALGETHPDFATSLNGLAALYRAQGNYRAAEPLDRQALEIRRVALGETHPSFATSLNNLAALYHDQGNYGAAEPLLRQALEILRTALGETHPLVAQVSRNHAALLAQMRQGPRTPSRPDTAPRIPGKHAKKKPAE